jgi:4-amino-4-deoxy-L-arabinose transferase-like glycosyltransferase
MQFSRATTLNSFENKAALTFLKENYAFIFMFLNLSLALFLRLYNLSTVPAGLNNDEAVNGVDAFSIAHTLRDHHGNFLPPMLESYGDWASPALTYLTVPFVWLLGLSEFSVRLPVALAGVASVFLMYLLVKNFTARKDLALLASFLLSIMPWHIISSRWAIPPNIVCFFLLLLLAAFCLVPDTQPRLWKYGLITLAAVLATYSYPTQKMFIPMLLGAFCLVDLAKKLPWKQLIQKYLIIGVPYLLLVSPIYLLTLLDPGKYNFRFSAVSIFSLKSNPVLEFSSRYISYFELDFNFGKGIVAYNFLAVFYYAGIVFCIYSLFSQKPFIIPKPVSVLLLAWLFIYPIAASLTIDYYYNTRVIHGFPLLIIFSVIGLAALLNLVKKRVIAVCLYAGVWAIAAVYLLNFSNLYFNYYPEITAQGFQYGVRDYQEYLLENDSKFSSVKVDTRTNSPYIYYLFYSEKDPRQYNYAENNSGRGSASGWQPVSKLGKYNFDTIAPEELAGATEIYAVKDKADFTWYKVYAKESTWYVVRQF